MFLYDDHNFEAELRTLSTVEEAIREARRYRRIWYGMLLGSLVVWGGLTIWSVTRGGSAVYAPLFVFLAVFYLQIVRADARIKNLLLRRQILRDSAEQHNEKG